MTYNGRDSMQEQVEFHRPQIKFNVINKGSGAMYLEIERSERYTCTEIKNVDPITRSNFAKVRKIKNTRYKPNEL